MGARGGAGVEIDVSLVPQRETGMTPYEIMLSESQERMLLVVEAGARGRGRAHLREVGPARRAHRRGHDRRPAAREEPRRRSSPRFPTRALTDEAPRLPAADGGAGVPRARRSSCRWRRSDARRPPRDVFRRLLASPAIASKRWVYRQYDHMVRTNTLVLPGHGRRRRARQGHDAGAGAVGRLQRAGSSTSIRSRARSWRWPRRRATSPAPAAQPIGATNCLNFGNPERPEIMWQFARAVEGMGAACRALDIPITGGNVSLYNETDGRAVLPTPVLGVVGLIEDADTRRAAGVPARPATSSSCSARAATSSAAAST